MYTKTYKRRTKSPSAVAAAASPMKAKKRRARTPVPKVPRPYPVGAKIAVPIIPRKNLKLFQKGQVLNALPPDGANFATSGITLDIAEGTADNERLGSSICLWKIDVRYYFQTDYLSVVPEENLQLGFYQTKQLQRWQDTNGSTGVDNFSSLYKRPLGNVPLFGVSTTAPGTTTAWPPCMWQLDPESVNVADVLKVLNFKAHFPQPGMIAGTSTPSTLVTVNAGVNTNSYKPFRQMGHTTLKFPGGSKLTYDRDATETSSYMMPQFAAIDNQVWVYWTGETADGRTPDTTCAIYLHFDVWYTDN